MPEPHPAAPAPALARDHADQAWWVDADFWEELFDFIFPPEHLALGVEVARRAVALLGLTPPAQLVDLGCGPGRVAVPLARMGFDVLGVDYQDAYLDRARAWAAREGTRLGLLRQDLSRLGLEAAFDGALCVFTSFGYFADPADDARALACALRALRPGGRFLLETAHRDGVARLHAPREAERAGRRWREDPRLDPVSGLLEARWTSISAAGTRRFASRMRTYTASELGALVQRAGFTDVRVLGDLEGAPPSPDRYTVVVTATRP